MIDFGPEPFVSIVVPAYDEEKRISDCLRALTRLDYPKDRYEIIVVDNGSTDRTARIVGGYPAICLDEPRRGASCARNAGIRKAQGSIIAFIDADCVATTEWLSELLRGIESRSIGCFAGEFAPQPFRTLIDEYVHDRGLIRQETLLRYHPPVVATGNVAYRRAVFDQVGFFDESLTSGEDAELSWRMQKCTPFQIRYNEKAIVSHPHPDRLKRLIGRSYRIGVGIGRFRRKYPEDFEKRLRSPSHYAKILISTAMGALKVPGRILSLSCKGMNWKKSVAYPILDKLCTLAQEFGTWQTLRDQHQLLVSSGDADGGEPLFLNLQHAKLFVTDDPEMAKSAREEVRTLVQSLLRIIPNASVLLTGSFSVGEGKFVLRNGEKQIQSDYDLAVVSPSFFASWPRFVKNKLEGVMQNLSLSTDVEITLMWTPLLTRRLTTVGGIVVGGKCDVIRFLGRLRAPEATKSLITAYQFLVEAPLSMDSYSTGLSKALVRGAQAFLLHECRNSSRREWGPLSSIRSILGQMESYVSVFGKERTDMFRRAGEDLLGRREARWNSEDYAKIRDVLGLVQGRMSPPSRLGKFKDLVKHMSWLCRYGRLGIPRQNIQARILKCLQELTEAWQDGDRLDTQILARACRGTRSLCFQAGLMNPKDSLETYGKLSGLLASYIRYYPHKIHYPRPAIGKQKRASARLNSDSGHVRRGVEEPCK